MPTFEELFLFGQCDDQLTQLDLWIIDARGKLCVSRRLINAQCQRGQFTVAGVEFVATGLQLAAQLGGLARPGGQLPNRRDRKRFG